MSYIHRDITFPSSDGKNTIHAELFVPNGKEVRGVVQIAHGMIDYIGRYKLLAEALTEAGFVLAGNDHLGHGDSVAIDEDYGFFASKNGYSYVVDDLKKMSDILRTEFPGVPLVLLGHSMGSFLSRLYAEKYSDSIDAVIIHGTSGPNPAIPFGKAVIKIMKLIYGERARSKFVRSLAEGGYNNAFDKSEGQGAWLTRDGSMVADRPDNKRTNFIFTLSGYGDLFAMLGEVNTKAWYENFPKSLPALVISGDRDPVGDFGKGVRYVYDNLKANGAKVDLKLYEGARHELFNETNRDEVFADIIGWIEEKTLK